MSFIIAKSPHRWPRPNGTHEARTLENTPGLSKTNHVLSLHCTFQSQCDQRLGTVLEMTRPVSCLGSCPYSLALVLRIGGFPPTADQYPPSELGLPTDFEII